MNRKNLVLLALGSFAVLALPNAYAGKWGMAGCGVGSLIFEDQPGKIQILAGTTNDYFGQTFSITSGTSNCTESAHERAALFISINQVALQKDISRGTGEALNGLAQIYQCQDVSSFGQTLQSNYGTIYRNENSTAQDVQTQIESAVKSGSSAPSAASCKVLS